MPVLTRGHHSQKLGRRSDSPRRGDSVDLPLWQRNRHCDARGCNKCSAPLLYDHSAPEARAALERALCFPCLAQTRTTNTSLLSTFTWLGFFDNGRSYYRLALMAGYRTAEFYRCFPSCGHPTPQSRCPQSSGPLQVPVYHPDAAVVAHPKR